MGIISHILIFLFLYTGISGNAYFFQATFNGSNIWALTQYKKKDKERTKAIVKEVQVEISSLSDCNCKHVMERNVTALNANNINYAAGDTICVRAGRRDHIRFENFVGSASKPIVIINCGGQVELSHNGNYAALNLINCRNVKVTGLGDPSIKYGFKVSGTGQKASAVSMAHLTSGVEMEFVEIANAGFAGILAKTDGAIGRTFENLVLHDLYIHDVKGEGMYIGETKTPGMEFKKVRIFNNVITRTGWDLFQIANAVEDVEVYNNVFYDGGRLNVRFQNNGFQIGNNCRGKYYNNIIMNARAFGFFISGGSTVQVYNNYIENMNDSGIYFDKQAPMFSNSHIEVFDNYFMGIGKQFFRNDNFTNARTTVRDNKLSGNNPESFGNMNNITYKNNVRSSHPKLSFIDAIKDDFRLPLGSPYMGIGLQEGNTGHMPPIEEPINRVNGIVVTASSFQPPNFPVNTMDNKMETRWSAEGMNQYIKYDFEEIKTINSLDIAFFNGSTRIYYFNISLSDNDSIYKTVFSGQSSGTTDGFENYAFAPIEARYVKITGMTNSATSWNSINEVRINHASVIKPPVVDMSVTANDFQFPNFPENTLDNNLQTRWSAEGAGQWIKYDLAELRNVTALDIAFFNGDTRTSYFDIAVSTDDINWATLFSGNSGGTTAGYQNFVLNPTNARYVKITGNMNSVTTWNSISGVRIHHDIAILPPTVGTKVTASSFQYPNFPENTKDNDLQTRWSAEGSGQWIKYDLEQIRNISSLDIAFFNGNARTSYFDIAVSSDDMTWTTVYSGSSGGRTDSLEKFAFTPADARYVQITGRMNSVTTWNSISEVKINDTPPISVCASSFLPPNGPENTLDNNLKTWWSAEGAGQWISYDLQEARNISSLDIAFFNGSSMVSYFDIAVSNDSINWNTVFSGNSSGNTDKPENFKIPTTKARYVRIIGRINSTTSWKGISQVSIK